MSILHSTCNTTYESNKTTFTINEDSNTSVLQCLSFLYGIIEEIPDEFIPKLFESLLQV